ncbi:MAG: HAD family hydrolase [Promethearchaeota archaeon]
MPESHWDLVFDLHGVLADVNAVNRNYGKYLERVLVPTGLDRGKIRKIHEIAFNNWFSEIINLTSKFDEGENQSANSEVFMSRYNQIDMKWENFILDYLPPSYRSSIKPLLKTSLVEYEALASGSFPILFPEVNSVLSELNKVNNLRMYIASSASSQHVKGAVSLHNLKGFFQELIGYDTVKAPKKSKSGIYFRKMLQIIETPPERVIFVGDSIEEATLTTNLGMKFVLIWRKKSSEFEEFLTNKIEIIDNLSALIPIVKSFVLS